MPSVLVRQCCVHSDWVALCAWGDCWIVLGHERHLPTGSVRSARRVNRGRATGVPATGVRANQAPATGVRANQAPATGVRANRARATGVRANRARATGVRANRARATDPRPVIVPACP
jgi:hypothetical protein